jgi:teichuronic acid biosynthesis glycosyltransferase TuaC
MTTLSCTEHGPTTPQVPGDIVASDGSQHSANSKRLSILVYTTMFPNSVQPLWGNFVLERMRHLLPYADLSVMAPVPYFPKVGLNGRWSQFAKVPRFERFAGFEMHHPRYMVLPKVGMSTHAVSMFLGSLGQVAKVLRARDVDIIDAHYVYPDGLAAVTLASIFKKPVIVSARGSDINVFPSFRTIRPMIRKVLKQVDALIAVSQSLKDRMIELGCPHEKITVIGNGVDSVKFAPLPRSEMRRKLGLNDHRPIVLSVGHLKPNKGFHILIDAVEQLRKMRPDILLIIIGDGEYRKDLESRVRRLSLHHNVEFTGARPHSELIQWYSAANVFALASLNEGWPNVLLEAMACGVPVVATPTGGTPEVVVSDQLGLLCERRPEAFASALATALSRQWDHDVITAHAAAHHWNKVALRTLSLYESVIKASQRSRCSPNEP